MNADPVKQAWQASVEIAGAPPLEEVRKEAGRFYRRIWWRNAIEYAACVIVVIAFGIYAFTLPHVLQRAGSALVIAGTLFVAWQLRRRASAEPPERAGAMPLLLFARAQLVRQCEALRSVFRWYLLPFLPGMAVFMTGTMLAERANGQEPRDAVGFAVLIAMFAGIWWLNQLGARRLQRSIDEMDALTGGNE